MAFFQVFHNWQKLFGPDSHVCKLTVVNPLSPRINIQILQTDLYTFLLRIVERIWFKIKAFSLCQYYLAIPLTFTLDDLLLLLGENWCWSLLGPEGLMVCTSYKTTCNVLSHTQLWFWGDWVNLCVSGVGCVDSGNRKGEVLRKIHSPDFRSSGFGISTTPTLHTT